MVKNNKREFSDSIIKLTALWAFSESVLGGILHIFRVPFSGALLTGFAVIIITMIASFSTKRGSIFRSTIIVILVKATVSPYTPVNAYFAVLLQGILGELFFYFKNLIKISALLLAVTTMLFTVFQRILSLVILFGSNLWNAIDSYANLIIERFINPHQVNNTISFSYLILSVYITLHLIFGIYVGILAGRLPANIKSLEGNINLKNLNTKLEEAKTSKLDKIKKSKKWKKLKIYSILISLVFILVLIIHPINFKDRILELLYLVARGVFVMIIWFALLSPLLKNLLQKILKQKKSSYLNEINRIVFSFPKLKTTIMYCWEFSKGKGKLNRVGIFLAYLFVAILISPNTINELEEFG